MAIEIDEMTVDVDQPRHAHTPPEDRPAVSDETWLRQVQAALAEEEARRQRLVAD